MSAKHCVQAFLQFLFSAKSYVFSHDCGLCHMVHLVLRNEYKQLVTAVTNEANKDIWHCACLRSHIHSLKLYVTFIPK